MAKKPNDNGKLTPSQVYEMRRILYDDEEVSGDEKYTHVWEPSIPERMIEWFKEREEKLQEAERVETVHGQVSYVQKPLHPPSFAGFASHLGVSQHCLLYWSKRHSAFKDAYEECKAISENCVLIMGAMGAWNPNVVALMLKNLHGWADKVEAKVEGAVQLSFDDQDAEA